MHGRTVEKLVLVRLLTAGPETPARCSKTLVPYLEHRLGAVPAEELLEKAIDRLLKSGRVAVDAKGAVTAGAKGRRKALEFVGLSTEPEFGEWDAFARVYLVAHALGLPAPGNDLHRYATGDADEADAGTPEARDALAWTRLDQLMGTSIRRTTSRDVIAAVLVRLREVPTRPRGFKRLGAVFSRGREAEMDKVCVAIVRRWLDKLAEVEQMSPPRPRRPDRAPRDAGVAVSSPQAPGARAEETPAAVAAAPRPVSDEELATFAEQVVEAGRMSDESKRWGEDLVFIAEIWEKFRAAGYAEALDEAEFKAALTRANNRSHLELRRADLIEAMDPDMVAASETRYLNAKFHFVRI